jgi:hypothetical protein
MDDGELAMYGADAAKLSPKHARKISQIQARNEDKNTRAADKEASREAKEAQQASEEKI